MSQVGIEGPLHRTATVATTAFTVLGCAALAARPLLAGEGQPFALAVLYTALLAGSLVDPPLAAPGTARRAIGPLVIGLGALAVARAMDGPGLHPALGGVGIGLTVLVSIGEEAFFRRFLYERFLRAGAGFAVAASAVLFALVHLPAYGPGALWVDLGAGLLLGWQRWASGTWLVPAATHVAANLLVVMG